MWRHNRDYWIDIHIDTDDEYDASCHDKRYGANNAIARSGDRLDFMLFEQSTNS